VQGGAVGDLAVVPEEVEVAQHDGAEAGKVLWGLVLVLISH
jgi:hypothetical protein